MRLIDIGLPQSIIKLTVTVRPGSKVKYNEGKCRVPSTADTGCCALEIGKCQPQYRIQQHKLTQEHLIRSPTRPNYCTHTVKTKRGNYNVQDEKGG